MQSSCNKIILLMHSEWYLLSKPEFSVLTSTKDTETLLFFWISSSWYPLNPSKGRLAIIFTGTSEHNRKGNGLHRGLLSCTAVESITFPHGVNYQKAPHCTFLSLDSQVKVVNNIYFLIALISSSWPLEATFSSPMIVALSCASEHLVKNSFVMVLSYMNKEIQKVLNECTDTSKNMLKDIYNRK